MMRRACLITVVLTGLLWPDAAQAKRFKRYPDDVTEAEQKSDEGRKTDGAYQGKPGKADPLEDVHQGKDLAPKEEEGGGDEPDDEPEEAPGLLGYALHGRNGIKLEYIYTGDVFTNMRGGISTRNATNYLGLFDLALTADLDEMRLMPGGTFFLLFEDSHGRGITEPYVGDYQWVDNIDAGRPFTQVTEYWWERAVGGEFMRVRLGKQDANAEFAVVDLGGDFINSSFGLHPSIPMPAWPDPAMGAVTFFEITDWLSLKVGVFDGAADGGSWGFSGTGAVFSIYEFKGQWSLLNGRLPGDYHVGMWYHNDSFDDVGGSGQTYTGDHGVYMGLDQLVCKESWDEGDAQGLGVFFQYAWAPEDRNEVPNYVGGGLVYKGLIPGRDDDVTGLGVAHAIFSERMADRSAETAIELFYKAQLSPYIVVQPDLQFVARPSGIEHDAFVFGLRFEVVL